MPSEPLHEAPNYVSPSVTDVYSYETLPSGYIRYLLLQPGESGDPVVCSIHVTKLEDSTPFEAISYVWGTSELTEPIECDDKTLYITVNLRNALLAVRRLDEARALWSDSICINQVDNEEKSRQVSLMAEIFRKSTRTLICLGSNDAGQHAEAAAGIITAVNDMMDKVFQDEDFSWEPDSFPFPNSDEPLLSDPRWESVATLTGQPWFRRGWVVQEAALGPVAEIIWGGVHIDWLRFLRAYSWLHARAIGKYYEIFQSRGISWLHLMLYEARLPYETRATSVMSYNPSYTFLKVLDLGRKLGVTDPRDRIYAFSSLLHSTTSQAPQLTSLKPDYNKAHVQVYHDFACKYLEMSGMDLDLLGYTENFGHTIPAVDCPSWVPLWDVHHCYTVYRSGSRRHSSRFPSATPSLPCLVDRNTLKVRGVRIGSVHHVTEILSQNTSLETLARIWREVEGLSTSSHLSKHPYHASAMEAFVRTLAAANYIGDLDGWESRQDTYMDYIQRRINQQQVGCAESKTIPSTRAEEDKEDIVASVAEMHYITMLTAHNRKFVVSDRGYYALAPFTAEKGDALYIIFGTGSPFILRQASDASPGGTQKYKLVGDVFMFSARGAESGDRLMQLGDVEGYCDWEDWGLQEQDMLIC